MPCIIKANQLLFEFQISFLWLLQLIIKKSGLYHHRSRREDDGEKWKRVRRLFKSRTLRKVRHSSAQFEIMEIIQGEGREREFKSLRSRRISSRDEIKFKEPRRCCKIVRCRLHHQRLFQSDAYS